MPGDGITQAPLAWESWSCCWRKRSCCDASKQMSFPSSQPSSARWWWWPQAGSAPRPEHPWMPQPRRWPPRTNLWVWAGNKGLGVVFTGVSSRKGFCGHYPEFSEFASQSSLPASPGKDSEPVSFLGLPSLLQKSVLLCFYACVDHCWWMTIK